MKKFIYYFKRLWNNIPKKYKTYYYFYMIVSFVNTMIFLIIPFIYKNLIDNINEGIFSKEYIYIYVVLTIVGYVSIRFFSLINISIRENLIEYFLSKLFKSIIYLDRMVFKKRDPGYWTGIMKKDMDISSQLFLDFVYTLPAEFLNIVIIFIIISLYSYYIALIILGIILLNILINLWREKKVIPIYANAQEKYREMNEVSNSYLKGFNDIKYYNYINSFSSKMKKNYQSYESIKKSYFKRDFMSGIFLSFLNDGGNILCVGLALLGFIYGNYSFGTAILIIQFSSVVYQKSYYFFENIKWLQTFPDHIEKVINIFDNQKIIKKTNDYIDFKFLELDNVSFSYEGKNIIDNFSMKIKKSDKVQLKGNSGSGKTTLINLICGNIKSNYGKINFIGNPKIGVLNQQIYLFNRTIKENMLSVKSDTSENEIITAMKTAGLDDFLTKNSYNLDLTIGQESSFISGGEKVRLSLAKLILYNPEFVILDEPLTGVDKKNKTLVINALSNYLRNKTCLIISHDEDVAKLADRIVDLKRGDDKCKK